MKEKWNSLSPSLKIYFILLSVSALGLGLSNGVISNYFKDVYDVTAFQRGLIEFPRELPGVITVVVIGFLAGFSDIRIAVFAQSLTIIGILILGVMTPPFEIMLIFLFINSMGMHMGMPLRDSIGMDLIEDKKVGKRMGQFKGVFTGFTMLSAVIVFIGFRTELFSFKTDIKWIFIVSGFLLIGVLILYGFLAKSLRHKIVHEKKVKFIVRKEYKYYYVLTVMLGVQKQIMLVYGPWVLIETLSKGPDTIAVLSIVGSFIGIFFIPALGRWTDKFGIKTMLYADALSFIGVYVLYGFLAAGFTNGNLALVGVPVFLAYLIFIIDRMSTQMGLIRTIYLKQILVDPQDFTPSLSLGLSLDHIVSIFSAFLGGIVWGKFGPQYIFFMAASLSLVNLYVAIKVKVDNSDELEEQTV
ncbi:MAG: MFS transporter [Clostridia bacterium]|nr:MFS transporter [Clostridia bacterium]